MTGRNVDAVDLAREQPRQIGLGPDLVQHACLMGLEGLVSKRSHSWYRARRSPNWD
jgi:bifunctional non-homologous end joining protein LigD